MATKIFYHVKDLDGHCSGAIARYYYEEIQHVEDIEMVPFDYGFEVPEIRPDDNLVFVDITIQPYEKMIELAKTHDVVIIDHHKTFIDFAEENGLYDLAEVWTATGTAACEIAWESWMPTTLMPDFVRLLGRYDVWDNSDPIKWEEEILAFQYGARMLDLDPGTDTGYSTIKYWIDRFLDRKKDSNELYDIIANGSVILEYQAMEDSKHFAHFGFEAEFEGLRAICMNSPRFNSKVFDSVWDSRKYDIMVCFANVKSKYYSVSLYSPKPEVVVGSIARKYGGGGHTDAAGFQCSQITTEEKAGKNYLKIIP